LRWKYVAESGMQASPVVADGVVYVATKEGSIHALDFATGSRIFEKRIAPATLPKEAPKGFGWSTPLVLDDILVIGSDEAKIYGISRRDGSIVWEVATGDKVWASPKYDGRLVHVGALDGKWYAINPKTGAVEWTLRLGGEIGGSACILGDEAAVTSRDKKLHLIDLRRGKLITSVDTGGHSTSTPTLAGGGLLFLAVRRQIHRGRRGVAHDPLEDRKPRAVPHVVGDRRRARLHDRRSVRHRVQPGRRHATLVFAIRSEFRLVAGLGRRQSRCATGADSKLWVFDGATGAGGEVMDLGEGFAASPAVVDGLCIVCGTSGTVFAIE
jgi:outer membrane protein assembly factor BamB